MDKSKVVVLLDNGHGDNTPGKRSPDGKIREYEYARRIVSEVSRQLKDQGYRVNIITPEVYDVTIGARVSRINTFCKSDVGQNLLVSVHLNAAGDGSKWMGGRGWEVIVSMNASSKSKKLAEIMYLEARKYFKVRPSSVFQSYKVQNLGICRDSICPAILTENLFMDNMEDASALQTGLGFAKIVQLHVEGIKKYIAWL